MNTLRLSLLLGTTLLACTAAAGAGKRAATVEELIPVVRYSEPSFPPGITQDGVSEGFADVGFVLHPDGKLQDCFVREYSDPSFAMEVERAVRAWEFKPIEASQPQVARRYFLRFDFVRQGLVTVSGPQNNLFLSSLNASRERSVQRPSTMSELDRIPTTLSIASPQYPAALKEKHTPGSVVVTFYIDDTGRVRIPGIVQTTHADFGIAALEAIRQWQFAPPLRRGQPVWVFAVQDFVFSAEAPVAKGTVATESAR